MVSGPLAATILADQGADVIKVEPPQGDGARSVPPLPPDYANPTAENLAEHLLRVVGPSVLSGTA